MEDKNKLAKSFFKDKEWREYLENKGHNDFTYGMSMGYNNETKEMLKKWNPKDSNLKK